MNSICKLQAGYLRTIQMRLKGIMGVTKLQYGTTLRSLFDQTQGRHDE